MHIMLLVLAAFTRPSAAVCNISEPSGGAHMDGVRTL